MTLIDALRDIAHTGRRKTGVCGSLIIIPTGWAAVTLWPRPGADEYGAEPRTYTGPVVKENADWIELEIQGDTMTFPMSRVTVRR